eukprot:2146742-Amphidinium_carterae.1
MCKNRGGVPKVYVYVCLFAPDGATAAPFALLTVRPESMSEKEVWLQEVARDGDALSDAPAELKRDRDVVLMAVAQNGFALRHAAEELKGDREVVLRAVAFHTDALVFAADSLLEDESFAAEARENIHFYK